MSEKQDHIYEIIAEILDSSPRLTQRGLAKELGVNPAAVNRMLHGARQIKAREIPVIESYLGVKLDLSLCSRNGGASQEKINSTSSFSDMEQQSYIPVYSASSRELALDETKRHPMQSSKGGGIAFYITSESMVPRYFYGEMVYIQKGRPPEKNKDCYIEMTNGSNKVLHFLGVEGEQVKVRQFNPDKTIYIDSSDIKSISAVVGRN